MNKEITEKVKLIYKEIENTSVYQNFKQAKKALEDNDELNELKKLIVRYKNEGRNDEYNEALEKYNCHPIYTNYLYCKNEIDELLYQIKEIINIK